MPPNSTTFPKNDVNHSRFRREQEFALPSPAALNGHGVSPYLSACTAEFARDWAIVTVGGTDPLYECSSTSVPSANLIPQYTIDPAYRRPSSRYGMVEGEGSENDTGTRVRPQLMHLYRPTFRGPQTTPAFTYSRPAPPAPSAFSPRPAERGAVCWKVSMADLRFDLRDWEPLFCTAALYEVTGVGGGAIGGSSLGRRASEFVNFDIMGSGQRAKLSLSETPDVASGKIIRENHGREREFLSL